MAFPDVNSMIECHLHHVRWTLQKHKKDSRETSSPLLTYPKSVFSLRTITH